MGTSTRFSIGIMTFALAGGLLSPGFSDASESIPHDAPVMGDPDEAMRQARRILVERALGEQARIVLTLRLTEFYALQQAQMDLANGQAKQRGAEHTSPIDQGSAEEASPILPLDF